MPARQGPRGQIATTALLQAVATRGRWWPAAFRTEEALSVSEALDRELLNGTLLDAQTLSPRGERTLAEHLGRPNDQALIDLRIDHACREHETCWTIRCARCGPTQFAHVSEHELEDRVARTIADHVCGAVTSPAGPAAQPR